MATSNRRQKTSSRDPHRSRELGRDRIAREAVVEDDVIVEEVLPEEEECSQMNFLSGRDEISSAKLQEIYDRKFARAPTRPLSRPKSDSSLRSSSTRTVDLTSARKSAHAQRKPEARETQRTRQDVDHEVDVDEDEVEKIVKQMKAAKVYDYDAELGIRTVEAESDSSDDDDDDTDDDDVDNDGGGNNHDNNNNNKDDVDDNNENQNQNNKEKKKKKKRKVKKGGGGGAHEDVGDIDPLFGKRGKCPLQLLSEFIDAVTLKEYESALNLCNMILIFEPTNETALEFIPNLQEKIKMEEEESSGEEDSSDSSESEGDDSDSESETEDI